MHNGSDNNALFAKLFKKLLREMESRRRSGGRAFLLCVHRLVAVFIPELFGDIRGQRHLPYSVEHREDIVALVFEFQKAVSALDALQNLCTKKPVPEYNFSTRLTAAFPVG